MCGGGVNISIYLYICGHVGPSWGRLETPGSHLGAIMALLGAILGSLGACAYLLGPSWGHLEASRTHVVPILGPLVAILGPSWRQLGASGDHLGASWSHLVTIFRPLDAILVAKSRDNKNSKNPRENQRLWQISSG